MDEDDSQDELINRSASHGKGKRPAVWAISDDSDDAEERSDEGETDSGEEEEGDEDPLDGEDDESDDDDDDDDEEEEEEEEDSGKASEGAVGGVSADPTGLSSDEDGDKCPICLNSFHSQPVATPESCEHYFCLDCILEWSKNANSCPVDRIVFNNIYLRKCFGGKVQKMITVQKPVKEGQEGGVVDQELEQTSCEVCGGRDREDRLLLCDGCDAGYHMECLTPPLDAVPVEEWFCPECEANNRQSRGSAEELSETDSLPSARPTTSRPRPSATGPTRAIARTQQSERVRANVNRHRITQARTARTARTEQFTPRFLMQSTWLDETINAVVAGLNTAVYVRDLTPRARRRKTGRRRKGSGKRASSAKGEKGKEAGNGVRRRRRKVRRKKSRRRLVVKKQPTSRGRIAHNLGMAKPKKGTTLPTVCRPSEQSLGSMRADIGAASFSVYGDPFGLDPFDYAEEEEQQVTSLLDAKRRGLSRSALRSHQPVARPITAGLSRQSMSLPQSEEVAVAAPVPDLLGSILSGQSMLLMDSSEVVINRDGSLKAMKPVSLPSLSRPDSGRSGSSSGDTSAQVTPGMSPVPAPTFSPSVRPTSSSSSSQSSPGPCLSPLLPCSPPPASHSHPAPHLQCRNRPSPASALSQRGVNGMAPHRGTTPNSTQPGPDSGPRGRDASQSQVKKVAPKPVWVDVAVLPRIPKLKRESGSLTNGGSGSPAGGGTSNGLPEGAGVHSLAGDRARQRTVDQKQQQQQQGQRSQPGRAAPSPAFSSSFSSSTSSSSGSPASLLRSSSSSSSSSATVSFRIAGGSSWHSRRLGNTSSVLDGVGTQEDGTSEDEEAKKKRERRMKHLLSDSHNQGLEEEQNAYDPFNPTGSDSNFSDSDAENQSQHCNSQSAPTEATETGLGNEGGPGHQVKTETTETRISWEQDQGSAQHPEVKKDPDPSDTEEGGTSSRHSLQSASRSGEKNAKPSLAASLLPIKKERSGSGDKNGQSVQSLSSAPSHPKISTSSSGNSLHSQGRVKIKSEPKDSPTSSRSRSRSPARPSAAGKRVSKGGGSSRERHSTSSSPDDGRRRGGKQGSGQGSRRRDGGGGGGEENRDRQTRPSDSRERRRKVTRSSSSSSDSDASEKYRRKKRRSRSRSKDRRRSRSGSDSSSRGRSRSKKQKPGGSRERNDSGGQERDRSGRPSKDQRRGRSRSRSQSRSRERRKEHPRPPQPSSSGSKNRLEDRPKDRRRARSRSRSRSRSQERRKEGAASKSSQKTPSGVSAAHPSKHLPEEKEKKRARDAAGGSFKEERDAREKKPEVPSSSWTPKEKAPLRLLEVKAEKDPGELRSDSRAPSEKPTKAPKVDREIKKETISSFDIFEDSPGIKSLVKEPTETASPVAIKDEREHHQAKEEERDPVRDGTCTLPSEDTRVKNEASLVQVKAEPPWSELADQPSPAAPPFSPATPEASPCSPCSPYSPGSPAPQAASPADRLGEASSDPAPAPEAPAACSSSGRRAALAKPEDQAPCDSEDEDFNVDMMLDSLDFVRPAGGSEGAAGVKKEAEVKAEGGQVAVAAGAKNKATGKRVTWNITEPTEPHHPKSASKLALYKLKLKQEAARRPNFTQPSKKDGGDEGGEAGADPGRTGPADAGDLEAARMCPVYLKKLHMQERAVEEVKLAIKPFYRNREITKEEYKDILRKAVQKVCHSKSGEINPVKVANLVKAYVEKYKHARKHRKGEEGQNKHEGDRDSDSQ